MDARLTPILPQPAPEQRDRMMARAEDLEAMFLAEMLGHAGLGQTSAEFGGGPGEEQFFSLLKHEQARMIVAKGGIGLAELIFSSMVEASHVPGN